MNGGARTRAVVFFILHPSAFILFLQEDVGRLDVAMDPSLLVNGGQPARDLHGDANRLGDLRRIRPELDEVLA